MKFSYLKTSLNRYTFKSFKIRNWVEEHVEGKVLNLFAGTVKLNCNEVRNDLNPNMRADFHMDALKFVRWWKGDKFDTVLLDPPYSYRKSMEKYDGRVTSPFNRLKDALCEILSPGDIVITFGYQSVSMGRKRGFLQEHLLLMSHGGAIHDTIAVIEKMKLKCTRLDSFFKIEKYCRILK